MRRSLPVKRCRPWKLAVGQWHTGAIRPPGHGQGTDSVCYSGCLVHWALHTINVLLDGRMKVMLWGWSKAGSKIWRFKYPCGQTVGWKHCLCSLTAHTIHHIHPGKFLRTEILVSVSAWHTVGAWHTGQTQLPLLHPNVILKRSAVHQNGYHENNGECWVASMMENDGKDVAFTTKETVAGKTGMLY